MAKKLCEIRKVVDCCEVCPHFQEGDDWEPFDICGETKERFPHDFDARNGVFKGCRLPDAEEEDDG